MLDLNNPVNTDTPSIPVFQSPLLAEFSSKLHYGFTGKPCSMGGPRSDLNPDAVIRRNQRQLLVQLGVPELSWGMATLCHGHRVGRSSDPQFKDVDSILVLDPRQPVLMTFGDCVPIILYDPVTHTGALVHAGWRGTAQQVAVETVLQWFNAVGPNPKDIRVVFGPAISGQAYEVSESVAQALAQTLGLDKPQHEENLLWTQGTSWHVDLRHINQRQLEPLGITQFDHLPFCTKTHHDQFYSHRCGDTGRLAGFLMLL